LRALKDHEHMPLGQALAAVSWALVLLLQAMCLAEPAGSTADEVTNATAVPFRAMTRITRSCTGSRGSTGPIG